MMVKRNLSILLVLSIVIVIISNCSDTITSCPDTQNRPKVISTYPVSGDTIIPTDTFFMIRFNKTMDPSSISSGSITLSSSFSIESCNVTFDSVATVTITPYNLLKGRTVYSLNVNPSVRDVSGIRVDVPYSTSFTTGDNNLLIHSNLEFTVRDTNNDNNPDEFLLGGPPGRFLQSGVNGSIVDKAIIEFPIDQIDPDSVFYAIVFVELNSSSNPFDSVDIESWGFVGDGIGSLSDFSIGALSIAYSNESTDSGDVYAFPLTDFVNEALDNNADHVGIRIEFTRGSVVTFAPSDVLFGDDKPRLVVSF